MYNVLKKLIHWAIATVKNIDSKVCFLSSTVKTRNFRAPMLIDEKTSNSGYWVFEFCIRFYLNSNQTWIFELKSNNSNTRAQIKLDFIQQKLNSSTRPGVRFKLPVILNLKSKKTKGPTLRFNFNPNSTQLTGLNLSIIQA